MVNRFFCHTLDCNITPLAIITRKKNEILKCGGGRWEVEKSQVSVWLALKTPNEGRQTGVLNLTYLFSQSECFLFVLFQVFHSPHISNFPFSVVFCVIMAECVMFGCKGMKNKCV